MVEHQLPKLRVAGSIPVTRSNLLSYSVSSAVSTGGFFVAVAMVSMAKL